MNLYLDKNLCLDSNVPFDECKLALMGVPFDSSVTHRSGTRKAPHTIRREFLELEKDVDGKNFFEIPFHDVGNIQPVHGSVKHTFTRISSIMESAREQNPDFIPFTLGGEHTISYPFIENLSQEKQDLEVIILDAHLDMKSEQNSNNWGHSTVTYNISRLGVPVTVIGARTYSKEELENASKAGTTYCGVEKGLDEVVNKFKKKTIYLSIDLDVLDPSIAPGVSNPQPGGMDLNKLLDIVYSLVENNQVVGVDLVEVCPPYDNGITSITTAHILLSTMMKIATKDEQ